jgi:hypothetical protein
MGANEFGASIDVGNSPIHYVSNHSASPSWPFTSWATAAHELQNAVDTAAGSDRVIVADGTYDAGGAITPGYTAMNRVVITNDISLQSVSGAESTFIVGEGPIGTNAVRGVYMSAGTLSGFTITGGHTLATGNTEHDRSGGGIHLLDGNGVVHDCILIDNEAAEFGGGSYRGQLNNCLVMENGANLGGGAYESHFNNSVLYGNSASLLGGGTYMGAFTNCIVYFNSVSSGSSSNTYNATVAYSCVNPVPGGTGNTGADPQFSDALDRNFRLQSTSPCIDSGLNAALISTFDIYGRPRPLDGDANGSVIVDMGLYEHLHPLADSDGDGLLDGQEGSYGTGLLTSDSDEDGVIDGDEVSAGMNPTHNDSAALTYGTGIGIAIGQSDVLDTPESYGLYTESAFQVLALDRPLISYDSVSNKFTLTLGVLQAPDLFTTFSNLTGFTTIPYPGDGQIDIEFTPPNSEVRFFEVYGTEPAPR